MNQLNANDATPPPIFQEASRVPFPSADAPIRWEWQFPPLSEEFREILPTAVAAFHLNRKPQTLRVWASLDSGPIRPIRVFGKLGWRTADIKRLLEVAK